MKTFLKNNGLLLGAYFVLLLTALYFLFTYQKIGVTRYVNQFVGNYPIDNFFYYITYLGDGRLASLILLGIMIYNVRTGIYAVFSFLSATIVANSLKYFFFDDIHRPSYYFNYFEHQSLKYVDGVDIHLHNSFPSGHATQAFAILLALAFVSKNQNVKFLFLLTAVLTSFSRVYLSQHWLTDITAGSIIGMSFAILYYFVLIYKNRFAKLDRSLKSFRSS